MCSVNIPSPIIILSSLYPLWPHSLRETLKLFLHIPPPRNIFRENTFMVPRLFGMGVHGGIFTPHPDVLARTCTYMPGANLHKHYKLREDDEGREEGGDENPECVIHRD